MSLLVALHDVAPPTLAATQRLRAALARWGVPAATLLAVPRYHDRVALGACRATTRFLREQSQLGDEVCLHGDRHLQSGVIPRLRDRVRAGLWTDGEGECLALDEAARITMLAAGRDVLQDLLGQPVHGFVAPAWLEPPGFHHALERTGFAWHEGGPWIERLGGHAGRNFVSRLPVIGFATRTVLRQVVSVSWAKLLGRFLAWQIRRGHSEGRDVLVRVALHPADLASATVMATAETLVRTLLDLTPGRTYATALKSARRLEVLPAREAARELQVSP